jgi:hypothetical protein
MLVFSVAIKQIKKGHVMGNTTKTKITKVLLTGAALVLAVVGLAVVSQVRAASDDYTATASEVTDYLGTAPGASLNDILANFASDTIVELPAGDYQLSDNLIVTKRLTIRGADNTTPDQVVIDGQSYFNGGDINDFQNGYFIDLAYASTMIEGVTLTHLGTSVIDFTIDHSQDMPAQYTGYSIAVRGGTLNRNIIVDNVGLFPETTSSCKRGGSVIGLFSGTLSGNLIVHNGAILTYGTPNWCYYEQTTEIIFAMGTSHLVGNTITNNVSYGRNMNKPWDWMNAYSAPSTVNAWDDPILENNVIAGNGTLDDYTYSNSSYIPYLRLDDYQVTMGLHNAAGGPSARVAYKDNWIHKDTENNIIGGNGADLFADFPASYGATTDGILPSFDYRPKASSALIDAGTDVFYPSIPQDLSGNSHFLGAAVDLGAYESNGAAPNFTQYPNDIVYVTEHGNGNGDGTSWSNAIDGNANGGPQNASIAAVRGGAHQIWFAEGDYNVPGREILYTRAKSLWDVVDNFTAGVWSGLLLAPSYNGDTTGVGHMQIYGGFVGDETSADARPSFKYENSAGTEIGTTLRGSSVNGMTHFIGQRGLAADGGGVVDISSVIPMAPMQPDYLNLINQDPATLRQPTLPSQGVHVISQVEYAGNGVGEGEFRPLVDGVEISNGFSAIYSQMLWGTESALLDTSTYGGAGIFLHGGVVRNSYVHDNYDAVTTFMTWFMSCGGGIFMVGGTIDNAVVTDNVSETTGGGVLLDGARLLGSYVAGNYAFKEGGGVHTGTITNNTSVPAEITNTVITDNHTLTIPTEMFSEPSGNGGGLWMSDANPTKVRDVTVYGNSATSISGQETTTGLGDNIYFAGGELTNVVALGAGHETDVIPSYSLTILDSSPLVAWKADLEGAWVLDDAYDYSDGNNMQIRYKRAEPSTSPYYYYINDFNGPQQYFHVISEDGYGPDSNWSVGPINNWVGDSITIFGVDTPISNGTSWEMEMINNNATGYGYDIYVADDGLLDKVTYSAFNTAAGVNGAAALGATNLTGLSDADAIFENVAARNFRLAENSLLLGKGAPIGDITYDIAGVQRKNSDIGAYVSAYVDPDPDNNGNGGGTVNTPGIPNTGNSILENSLVASGGILLAALAVLAMLSALRISRKSSKDFCIR